MSQTDKAAYFNALKSAGVVFSKHYREYSTDELAQAYTKLMTGEDHTPPDAEGHTGQLPAPQDPRPEPTPADDDLSDLGALPKFELPDEPTRVLPPPLPPKPEFVERVEPPIDPATPALPQRTRPDDEMAGVRLNTQAEDEPLFTDDQGKVWYQVEVLKPGYAKPRGRRVLTYSDTGVEMVQTRDGEYTESFEVAGKRAPQAAQIKITLPSYQTGIYRDPRFPFKIHCYNGVEGFDFFEVGEFYGGNDLVPEEIKRMYVENVLCYDIRTTVRQIQVEYRQLQLQGKV